MNNLDLYLITGASMTPLLNKGTDAVLIEKIPISKIKHFDLIVFYTPNNELAGGITNIICHRVIKIDKKRNAVYEKGDHHFEINLVNYEQYIGRVKYIIKNGILYSLDNKRNKTINYILGILSCFYHLKVLIYIKMNPETSISKMCQNKRFRDSFFKAYRLLATPIINKLQPSVATY